MDEGAFNFVRTGSADEEVSPRVHASQLTMHGFPTI
jgi:hypothetical protein